MNLLVIVNDVVVFKTKEEAAARTKAEELARSGARVLLATERATCEPNGDARWSDAKPDSVG